MIVTNDNLDHAFKRLLFTKSKQSQFLNP